MPIRIAISIGDYNGIGPEVVMKSLQQIDLDSVTPVILGSVDIFEHYRNILEETFKYHAADTIGDLRDNTINLLNVLAPGDIHISPGLISVEAGKAAMLAVEKGIELCIDDQTDALVTAPISKEAVNRAGYAIPGHTEFLAEKTNTRDFIMMMVNDQLRVGLVSTHIPLREAVRTLSTGKITRYLEILDRSLHNDFGIPKPRLAVLGVNPHAGDGGMIGDEEIEMVSPAIEQASSNGRIHAEGPFPADGFFGNRTYKEFDGILAMYHDQGLIPFKTLSFGAGVNFTAGLPIIRTSPDHGTAFDIAGQGKASPESFLQAFKLAVELANKRKKESA